MLGLQYEQVLVRGVAVWVGCSMGELSSKVIAVTHGFEVSLTFKTASIGKTAKKSYVHVYRTPKNYPLNCGKGQF